MVLLFLLLLFSFISSVVAVFESVVEQKVSVKVASRYRLLGWVKTGTTSLSASKRRLPQHFNKVCMTRIETFYHDIISHGCLPCQSVDRQVIVGGHIAIG